MDGENKMDGETAPKTQSRFSKISLQQPSRRCIYIIVVVSVLCVLCIVLASVLSQKSRDPCSKGHNCDWRSMQPSKFLKDERCSSFCSTTPCLKSAEFALSRISASNDPCDNFYQFACGKFEREAVVLPEAGDVALTYNEMENELMLQLKNIIESGPSKGSKVVKSLLLAMRFYDDCMNTGSKTNILLHRDVLETIIGDSGPMPWPLINESISNDEDHMTKIMATSTFFDANPFFRLSNIDDETDANKKSKLIFNFREKDLEMMMNLYKERREDMERNPIFNQYASTILKIFYEIGVNQTDTSGLSVEFLSFERSLMEEVTKAKISAEDKAYYHEERSDPKKYNCRQLDIQMSSIKWCKMIKMLLEQMGKPMNSVAEIYFHGSMDYYEAVHKTVSQVQRRVVINYMVLKFIIDHLKYMSSPLSEMYYQNLKLFPPQNMFRVLSARWQQCIDAISGLFWIPLEAEYLHSKSSTLETLMGATIVMKKVKEQYVSIIGNITWIDDATRKGLTEQVSNIKFSLGNLDLLLANKYQETSNEVYSNILRDIDSLKSRDSRTAFLEDILIMKQSLRKLSPSAGSLELVAFESALGTFPDKVDLDTDFLRLSYGMFNFPMYLDGRPMYLEFASFGAHISNILTLPWLPVWLKNNVTQKANSLTKCLRNQYIPGNTRRLNIPVEIRDWYWNFHNTFASLASFQTYSNYMKEEGEEEGLPGLPLSNEQLFFTAFAQMHCEKLNEDKYRSYPVELVIRASDRVNVPLSNSEAFSKAFRCPVGSNMNPEKKCCILGNEKTSEKCK